MQLLSDEPAVQQARAHSGRIVRALNDLAALVQEAWDRRYDKVLRYKSWQAYCTGEFGSGETAIRARQIITVMLRGEDLTEKAIADQLGVSQPTVNRDLSDQDDYEPARGGRTGSQRRARRRVQYQDARSQAQFAFAVPDADSSLAAWTELARTHPSGWTYAAREPQPASAREPAAIDTQPAMGHEDQPATTDEQPAATLDSDGTFTEDDQGHWHRIAALPAASTIQSAMQPELLPAPAATEIQPATEVQPAATDDQPAMGRESAATEDQPAATLQPATPELPAATPHQPAIARERFLQGDTDGARAEIRRRVLAGQPVRREQLHAEFGVSEMFARQATAVEEEAAGVPDTVAHCIRELTALREKYARVLGANEWADQCLQLVIDSLRTD